MEDAIIIFTLKEKIHRGWMSLYHSEAFLMFKDIADIPKETVSSQQIHLKLTKPENEGETVNNLLGISYVS